MGILFISYRVDWNLSDSDGDGVALFQNNLLSGARYWNTNYEESNYYIDTYDVNLIFQ